MSGCLEDTILIRWIAGELPSAAAARAREHVVACESCRIRMRDMQATWTLLGKLRVEPAARDRTADILAAAAVARTSTRVYAARLAAAVAVAAGLGVTAGWLRTAPQPPTLTATASFEQVAASTGLDVLAPDGIMAPVFEQDPAYSEQSEEEAL